MRSDGTTAILAGDDINFDAGELSSMTDLLDRTVARTRSLPLDMQDEIARMVLLYAGEHRARHPVHPGRGGRPR